MLIDTHCHLDDEQFDADREEIIQNLNHDCLEFVINASSDFASSRNSLNLAETHKNIYATLGVHPYAPDEFDAEFLQFVTLKANHPKVIAIGEIGLDYHYENIDKTLQQEVFLKQLLLADKLNLPVVLHIRDAHEDALKILKQHKKYLKNGGVVHCFSGSLEIAKEYLKLGLYLGFDAPITYKNANKLLDVINFTPLDKILVETDSPYLPPQSMRGERNQPKNVEEVAFKLCEIKNISMYEFEKIHLQNIFNVFPKIKLTYTGGKK